MLILNNPHHLFKNSKIEKIIGNVELIGNISNMFQNAKFFNCDLSNWNVSSVENMRSMFQDASSFNGDISNWNVSNVTNMSYMFCNT